MSKAVRIVLVHAVTVAMEPVAASFAEHWPQAELVNLLDDSLSLDRAADGELTPAMTARFAALTRYALDIHARGILFTCSAFGDAIEAARAGLSLPVLKPNEAMFEAALASGRKIAMLATFEPSVASMEREFRDLAARSGASIETVCIPEAMAALKAGDAERHNRLLAEAAAGLGDFDALMLAQFSTSRALDAVSSVFRGPVLTSPGSAVERLKRALT